VVYLALTHFLVHDNEYTLLNGLSNPIHALNERLPINLTSSELAVDYLHFFCAAIHGDEGPFTIFDDAGLLLAEEGMLPEEVTAASALAAQVIVKKDEKTSAAKNWRLDAVVHYANAIFEAQFLVLPSGPVEMLDNSPLMADLDVQVPSYLCGIRTLRVINAGK